MADDNFVERGFAARLGVFQKQLGIRHTDHSPIKPPPNEKSDKEVYVGMKKKRNPTEQSAKEGRFHSINCHLSDGQLGENDRPSPRSGWLACPDPRRARR